MSLTLAIDTSTDVRVGLAAHGAVLASGAVTDPRAHAERLMPLIHETLHNAARTLADVTQLVVGVGPGPFTGLRVGVVAALTLGEALGVEVRGVCSLDPVAQDWARQGAPADFAVVADARRKEVYWARYGADGARVAGPFVTSPDQVPAIPLAGAGAALAGVCSGPAELDPALLAAFGNQLPDAGHEPLYLRRPDAEVPTKRKSTLLLPRLAKMEKQ